MVTLLILQVIRKPKKGGGKYGLYSNRESSLDMGCSWESSRGMMRSPNPIAEKNTDRRPTNICGHSEVMLLTE